MILGSGHFYKTTLFWSVKLEYDLGYEEYIYNKIVYYKSLEKDIKVNTSFTNNMNYINSKRVIL